MAGWLSGPAALQTSGQEASAQLTDLNSSSCMATIVSRYRTTVAMINSIHDLLSENHPCTLFMVSLHPGYHDPTMGKYTITFYGLMTGKRQL
jgi:hypothetical protein